VRDGVGHGGAECTFYGGTLSRSTAALRAQAREVEEEARVRAEAGRQEAERQARCAPAVMVPALGSSCVRSAAPCLTTPHQHASQPLTIMPHNPSPTCLTTPHQHASHPLTNMPHTNMPSVTSQVRKEEARGGSDQQGRGGEPVRDAMEAPWRCSPLPLPNNPAIVPHLPPGLASFSRLCVLLCSHAHPRPQCKRTACCQVSPSPGGPVRERGGAARGGAPGSPRHCKPERSRGNAN
jgi:hypothetical protein